MKLLEFRNKSFETDEFFFDYGKKAIKEKRKMGHLTILKIILFYCYTMHNSCTIFNFTSFMHYTKVVPNHEISFRPCVRKINSSLLTCALLEIF